ncbi:MAG: hypothetical protein ACLRRT_13085 [Ruthenibacterium lactatiformans]
MLAGCGALQAQYACVRRAERERGGDSNVNAEGFPIVNEPITLRGMVALNANVKDWNEHPALKRMEELTGIHIEWECVPDAGFTEKRNLAFASDDLPDIILRAKISPQEEMKYAANGQLVALDEYLDYAPNLSALIEQDDAIRKGITMPDGHIYSCPQLNKTEGNLIHHYWINKTWLDNLGLKRLRRLTSYDVLVAFRDNDPNGNGQRTDPLLCGGKGHPTVCSTTCSALGSASTALWIPTMPSAGWISTTRARCASSAVRTNSKIWWNFTTSCGRRAW